MGEAHWGLQETHLPSTGHGCWSGGASPEELKLCLLLLPLPTHVLLNYDKHLRIWGVVDGGMLKVLLFPKITFCKDRK